MDCRTGRIIGTASEATGICRVCTTAAVGIAFAAAMASTGGYWTVPQFGVGLVACRIVFSIHGLFVMPDYHPLDTRHKANKNAAATQSRKPWRHVTDPPPQPGIDPGPIRDSETAERRARENIGNAAEQAALAEVPWFAHLFSPAALYYKRRATLIGQRARGYGPGKIAIQIISAFALYFAFVYLDGKYGFNEMLGGRAEMYTID